MPLIPDNISKTIRSNQPSTFTDGLIEGIFLAKDLEHILRDDMCYMYINLKHCKDLNFDSNDLQV